MDAEEMGFRHAICAEPADDTRRLAFADWLDEHAGTRPCDWCKGSGQDRPPAPVVTDKGRMVYTGPLGPCPKCKGDRLLSDGRSERAEYIRLTVVPERKARTPDAVLRSRDLMVAHGEEWLREEVAEPLNLRAGGLHWLALTRDGTGRHTEAIDVKWRRAFPAGLVMQPVDWYLLGPTILEVVPVEAVTFDPPVRGTNWSLLVERRGPLTVAFFVQGEDRRQALAHSTFEPGRVARELCRPGGWLSGLLKAVPMAVPTTADCQRRVQEIWGEELASCPPSAWDGLPHYPIVMKEPWPDPTVDQTLAGQILGVMDVVREGGRRPRPDR